jgi:DNA-binding NarL/FixJ family response regulator
MTITVIVADDQPLMRAAIRTCLDAEPNLTVVAEAGEGETAVRLAERPRPDVVVMDVRMPVMTGIEATRRIVSLTGGPPIRVLMMTTFDVDEHIIDGLGAGTSGFLVKDATPDELLGAVRVIARGQAQLSPSVTRRLLDLHGASLPQVGDRAGDGVLAGLTPRELAARRSGRSPRPRPPSAGRRRSDDVPRRPSDDDCPRPGGRGQHGDRSVGRRDGPSGEPGVVPGHVHGAVAPAQTRKPSARSCSRPSSVILSGPHGGIQTQLIRMSSTRPGPGPPVSA